MGMHCEISEYTVFYIDVALYSSNQLVCHIVDTMSY